jgi:hypothetical protein
MKRTLPVLVCIAVVSALPGPALAADGVFGPVAATSFRSLERSEQPPVHRRAVKVTKARIGPNGLAVPPPSAPPKVVRIIAAGNRIATKPYKYGGGHGSWADSGYDCSGSVSYALHGAGLLDAALDSSGLAAFGRPGPGRWVTVMGNPGHAYMVVAGLRFDTSSSNQTGNRWTDEERTPSGYVVRHPPGL